MNTPTKYYVLRSSGEVDGPCDSIGDATERAEQYMKRYVGVTAQILAPIWEAKPGIKWTEVKPNA